MKNELNQAVNTTAKLAETAQKRGLANYFSAVVTVMLFVLTAYTMYSNEKSKDRNERRLDKIENGIVKSIDENTNKSIIFGKVLQDNTTIMRVALADMRFDIMQSDQEIINQIKGLSEAEKKDDDNIIIKVEYANDNKTKYIIIKKKKESEE